MGLKGLGTSRQPRKWHCGMMLEAANTKIASRSYIQDLGEFPSLIEAIFFHSLQLPPCFKMFSYPYVGGTIHQNNFLKLYPDSKQMPPSVHLQKKNEKRKRLVVDVARAQFLQLAEAAEAVFQLQDGIGSPDRAAESYGTYGSYGYFMWVNQQWESHGNITNITWDLKWIRIIQRPETCSRFGDGSPY